MPGVIKKNVHHIWHSMPYLKFFMYFSYTCMSQQSRGTIFEKVYRDIAYPCISLITHKLKINNILLPNKTEDANNISRSPKCINL